MTNDAIDASPTLTANGAALLGLLGISDWDRPWTTYELAKQARRSVHWVWPRAERLLYDIPKKLVKQGFASSEPASTGNRRSVQYTITDDGRRALGEWLDSEGAPPTFDIEQLIRVFYGDQGSLEQLRQNIERIEAQAVAARRSLGAIVADAEEPAAAGRAAVNALSIRLVADLNGAIETWALWARREVSGWESTAPDWPGARAVFDEVVRRGRE